MFLFIFWGYKCVKTDEFPHELEELYAPLTYNQQRQNKTCIRPTTALLLADSDALGGQLQEVGAVVELQRASPRFEFSGYEPGRPSVDSVLNGDWLWIVAMSTVNRCQNYCARNLYGDMLITASILSRTLLMTSYQPARESNVRLCSTVETIFSSWEYVYGWVETFIGNVYFTDAEWRKSATVNISTSKPTIR